MITVKCYLMYTLQCFCNSCTECTSYVFILNAYYFISHGTESNTIPMLDSMYLVGCNCHCHFMIFRQLLVAVPFFFLVKYFL